MQTTIVHVVQVNTLKISVNSTRVYLGSRSVGPHPAYSSYSHIYFPFRFSRCGLKTVEQSTESKKKKRAKQENR